MRGNLYRSACSAFFIAGFVLACWSPLVPVLKARLALSDGTMGLVLLLFGIGSLVAMPGAGYVAGRVGCRRVLSVTIPGAAVLVLLLALAPNIYVLSALLFLFGIFVGASDVVVNVNAALAQTILDRPIMSSMHALFSLGAFAGAGTVSFGLWLGQPAGLFLLVLAALVIGLYALIAAGVTDAPENGGEKETEKEEGSGFSLPGRSLLVLGAACWIAYLVEGAMLDWSGIYLVAQTHSSTRVAGFAFTVFSVAMMLGRLVGDIGVKKLGTQNMFRLSTLLLVLGLGGMVMVKGFGPLLVALAFIGLGLANVAPIIFSLTASTHPKAVAQAIAQVSTMGYAGILLGPALIGGIAALTSLNGAFYCVAVVVLLLCIAAFVRRGSRQAEGNNT